MVRKNFIRRTLGFTLVELVVSIAVLALLVALIGSLFNNATSASNISTNHLEADARVRVLFARMASDFSHIVKRNDVDYYLKTGASYYPLYPSATYNTNPEVANPETGNDQAAFFSEVAGYSSTTVSQNPISLVAYRVNNTGTAPCIERLGTALSWGGGTSSIYPLPFLPVTIASIWSAATVAPATSSTSDPGYDQDFETIVPNAFRFEYYYQLTSGALSVTPWDTVAGHSSLNGLQDVVGIGVVVAVTDKKASAIATSTSLQTLAGSLSDWAPTSPITGTATTFGTWQTVWQSQVNSSTLPTAVKEGIRVYEQIIQINTPAQ